MFGVCVWGRMAHFQSFVFEEISVQWYKLLIELDVTNLKMNQFHTLASLYHKGGTHEISY